ncbi:MAG: hypothetical protein ACW99A_17525 [Candidatus Kariarchaeaceae archaeon]
MQTQGREYKYGRRGIEEVVIKANRYFPILLLMGGSMVKISDLLEMNMYNLQESNLVNFEEVVNLLRTYKSITLNVKNTNNKIDYWEELAQSAYQNISKLGNSKNETELNKKAFENYVAEINHLEHKKSDMMNELLNIERRVEIISIRWDLPIG